ncbi:MAG: 50S ribosomal protein L11 methyltransferase [Pyrinomonadaceae bacterium]
MTGTKKREWYAVDVLVDPEACEAVESAFNVLGALGTEINSLRKKQDEPLVVTAFFDQPANESEIRSAAIDSLGIYGVAASALKGISGRVVPESDWLAEWKRHWKPTEIGEFVVAPPWSEVSETEKIVIRVEPNMAFGTGTHETTQLCLTAISELYHPDQTLLDVGTGTGILAIAAAKLGGTTLLACDTDIPSVEIARENAVLNAVALNIEFIDGPIDDETPAFDFVCANLTIDVIVPILDLLLAKAKHTLLLSGILAEQEPQICDALKTSQISDLEFDIERKGEWISVIVSVDRSANSENASE